MSAPTWNAVQVGDKIPLLQLPPLTRLTLALYCGASGDHNPIHVDSDFAKSAGLPDVFAHGMLSMAWLSRVLTDWVPQSSIRQFSVRFAALTQVGESITCTAEVMERFAVDGQERVRLVLITANENGEIKLTGDAVVAVHTDIRY